MRTDSVFADASRAQTCARLLCNFIRFDEFYDHLLICDSILMCFFLVLPSPLTTKPIHRQHEDFAKKDLPEDQTSPRVRTARASFFLVLLKSF